MNYIWYRRNTARRDQLWKTEVRVYASLATAVEQHLHAKRSAAPEMQSATSAGRRGTSGIVAGQRMKRRGVGKARDMKAETSKSPLAEGTSNIRDMTTTAIYSITQPVSTKRTTGSDVPPYKDSTSG